MRHLVVLLYVLSLGSGIAAFALFAFLRSRSREPALRTYLPYLGLYTLLMAVVSVLSYLTANGLVDLQDPEALLAFLKLYLAVFVPFLGGFIWVMPRFYAAFLGRPFSSRARRLTLALAAGAVPVLVVLLAAGFFPGLAAFLLYALVFVAVSTWVAVVVARRRPFVREPLVRAAILVISVLFGLSMGGAFAESFLMTRIYSASEGRAIYFSLVNPSFYLLWNALSIAFAWKRYLRPGEPLPAPGPTAAFLARHGITEREAQIIRAVGEGQSNKEIAYNLGLSANTVRNHIRSVFLKAEVMSRVQLLNAFRQQPGG
jgi:DNA-binding CsgD family transcriptional regulator